MHLHTAYTQPGCVVLYHQVFIGMVCDVVCVSECIPPEGRACARTHTNTHTQNQRFPEMRAAHVITNNWKIPLECPRSTWEELKDASESVVWKGRKSRMVNRKAWFVAWARHGSLCSRLSGEKVPRPGSQSFILPWNLLECFYCFLCLISKQQTLDGFKGQSLGCCPLWSRLSLSPG